MSIKKTVLFSGIIVFALVIGSAALLLTGCDSGTSSSAPTVIVEQPFTSIDDLKSYLLKQPDNAVYKVKLNVTDITNIKEALLRDVYLDLSGSTITSIGERAFSGCFKLTGITIPDSVTSIGEGAFGSCTNLTGITIPDSVTSIGEWAFFQCKSLTSVTIPNSVTSIGGWAFSSCIKLTGITIPNSVTSIGKRAFLYCPKLTGITIPNSVTSIGEGAFENCTKLTGITIPNSVISIGNSAFGSCTNLTAINVDSGNTNYSSDNGVLYNKTKTTLVAYLPGKSGAFTIPNSVTSIGGWAFSSCIKLTGITIPNSVTSTRYIAPKYNPSKQIMPQNNQFVNLFDKKKHIFIK